MPGGLLDASGPPRKHSLALPLKMSRGGGWRSQSVTQSVVPDTIITPRNLEDVDRLLKRGEAAVYKEVMNPPRRGHADEQAELVLVDSARGPGVGPARPPAPAVVLNVYDLSEDVIGANELLAFSSERLALGGFFHVGVEVFGSEWSFGCLGVSSALPRTRDTVHVYRCSVNLGSLTLGRARFAAVVWAMCQEWRGYSYQLLGHNCCNFASELCSRLGVGEMPGWVDRFARLLRPGQQAGERVVSAGQGMLLGLEVAYRRLTGTAAKEEEEARPPPSKASDGAVEDKEAGPDSANAMTLHRIRPRAVARSPEPARTAQSETPASPAAAAVSAQPPTPAPRRYLVVQGLRTPQAPVRAASGPPGAGTACASAGGESKAPPALAPTGGRGAAASAVVRRAGRPLAAPPRAEVEASPAPAPVPAGQAPAGASGAAAPSGDCCAGQSLESAAASAAEAEASPPPAGPVPAGSSSATAPGGDSCAERPLVAPPPTGGEQTPAAPRAGDLDAGDKKAEDTAGQQPRPHEAHGAAAGTALTSL